MKTHWLFGFPENLDLEGISAWADQVLATDPEAAAIPELEAEQFMAVAYLVPSLEPKMFNLIKKALRVAIPSDTELGRRRAIIRMLRQWKLPTIRNLLLTIVPRTSVAKFADPDEHPHIWTDELFHEAYVNDISLCFMVQVKRFLEPAADISAWLATLADYAPREYAININMSRVALRRLVYPPAGPAGAEREAAPGLIDAVRAKSEQSGALRQSVRRLEQDRKRLRADSRRHELERKQLVSQAQGELAAARRRLDERRRELPGELAAQARRQEAELARLRRELEQERMQFLNALRGRSADFLCGRSVGVRDGDQALNRALVETLGGHLTTADPAIWIDGSGRPADVEQQLHAAALASIHIRCDGSRRRKGRRPAIATSAFAVYVDGVVVHAEQRVICCGPTASSLMAEYAAVVMALSWLRAAGPAPGSSVQIWSDCRNMVTEVTAPRPLRPVRGCTGLDRRLRVLLRALERQGCAVRVRWVRRDLVDASDRLCDLAYREAWWYHRPGANGQRVQISAFLRALTLRS